MKTSSIYKQFVEYYSDECMRYENDTSKQFEMNKKRKEYFSQQSNINHRMHNYIISFMFRSSSRR